MAFNGYKFDNSVALAEQTSFGRQSMGQILEVFNALREIEYPVLQQVFGLSVTFEVARGREDKPYIAVYAALEGIEQPLVLYSRHAVEIKSGETKGELRMMKSFIKPTIKIDTKREDRVHYLRSWIEAGLNGGEREKRTMARKMHATEKSQESTDLALMLLARYLLKQGYPKELEKQVIENNLPFNFVVRSEEEIRQEMLKDIPKSVRDLDEFGAF